jgi:hypothetical protein
MSSPRLRFLVRKRDEIANLTDYSQYHKEHDDLSGQSLMRNINTWLAVSPLSTGGLPKSVPSIIIELNDTAKWTREQIADWLDTLDDQPVFYPDIKTGCKQTYIRTMNMGPAKTSIQWACGCYLFNNTKDFNATPPGMAIEE